MSKKVVFIAVLLIALSVVPAFAREIDSLASSQGATAPGQTPQTQVFVNPGGVGNALLYGYFNVRNKDQFFTITNTDSVNGARVRVRFREAKTPTGACNGSNEILDFDVCLSPADMWTGHIATVGTGSSAHGVLFSDDKDTAVVVQQPCDSVIPTKNGDIFSNIFSNGFAFKYGTDNPTANITADMTREGYFEVIGYFQLSENATGCATNPGGAGCCGPSLRDIPNSAAGVAVMGHNYIVDLGSTAMYGYTATALDDFWGPQNVGPTVCSSMDIASAEPNLRDDSETTNVLPVNYALTKSKVMGIYDLESALAGQTDAIITFPTKWATHTCTASDDIFDDTNVSVVVYDDAENSPTSTCVGSPCQQGSGIKLENEVNVITFNDSALFTSDVALNIGTDYDFGWAVVDMTKKFDGTSPAPAHYTSCILSGGVTSCVQAPTAQMLGGHTVWGWPTVGYAAHNFGGSAFTGMLPLQYDTTVTTPAIILF